MMDADALDTLLVKLSHGDEQAAERVFRDYEPFLRALVRKRLSASMRTKFDSMDIVQSVWTDVLQSYRKRGWTFHDRDHLQAFLARIAANHVAHQCRRNRQAVNHERPLDGDNSPVCAASAEPRPSQEAQAGELWETLARLITPTHREVLRLKRDGHPLAAIAEQTGLHEGSVRRILYDLARRLADERARQGLLRPLSR